MASVGTRPVKRAERDGMKARNCALKDPSLGMQAEIWRPPGQWRSSNSTWEGAAPTTSVVKVRILRLNGIPFLLITKPTSEVCNCMVLALIAYRKAHSSSNTF